MKVVSLFTKNKWCFHLLVETVLLILLLTVLLASGTNSVVKTMTSLAMPVGMCWIGFAHLTVANLIKKHKFAFVLSLFILTGLTLAGNSSVANWMMWSLESEYYDQNVDQNNSFDIVHVLGGATSLRPNGQAEVNANGDRLVEVAKLYHRGLIKRIYCSGQPIRGFSATGRSEAQLSMEILQDLGVDENDIEVIYGRNTWEEIQTLAASSPPQTRIGIVTSAWHMKRAMSHASRVSLRVIPIPSDFRSGDSSGSVPLGRKVHTLVPTASALNATTKAMREYLAMFVNR